MSASHSKIRVKTHEPIPLSDGCVLSAMTWMPGDVETAPVPAILEYLPYRKKDQTAVRDALNHPYFAAHGYACIRVDMRGSGDSEGVLYGEYLQQEQDDCLEVLKWIAAQSWCTGNVGMIGISWGGFNGLQVGWLCPPELKAIISICSTGDRYAGDIHYMGGCLLVDNFTWGASMFAIAPTPPDEADFGEGWRDLWLQRLESGATYVKDWHEHQTRDAFWRHASINDTSIFPSTDSPLTGYSGPGVHFYSAQFDLDLPTPEYDIPLAFAFTNTSMSNGRPTSFRCLLFVNGFQFGKYVNHIGPQLEYPVPEGILNYHGSNYVGISLWNMEAEENSEAMLRGLELKKSSTPVISGRGTVVRLSYKLPEDGWHRRSGAY